MKSILALLTASLAFATGNLALAANRSAAATELPKVMIFQEKDEQKAPLPWKFKVEPLWAINAEGGQEFYWGISLQVPSQLPISTVLDQYAEVGFSKGAQVAPTGLVPLYVKMKSLSDHFTVVFEDKSRVDFGIDLSFVKPVTLMQGCLENSIRVEPKGRESSEPKALDTSAKPGGRTAASDQVPGYIAVKCETSDTGVLLAVSVPEETKWRSSSIFESKGKGKRWRNFELNPQIPLSGRDTIGTFEFAAGSKFYPYAVIVEKREEKREIASFRLSPGVIMLNISAQGNTDALVKPAAHVAIEMRPWWPEFSLGGQGISSLPSVSGANYFTHTESVGYLGYTFWLDRRWSFEPRLYFYLADGISQKLQFFYTINMAAVGFETRVKTGMSSRLRLEVFGMAAANQNLTSVRLDWSKDFADTAGSWGLAAIYQMLGANLAGEMKGDATQTVVGPFLDF